MTRKEVLNHIQTKYAVSKCSGNVIWCLGDEGIVCNEMYQNEDGWFYTSCKEIDNPKYLTVPRTFLSCDVGVNAEWRKRVLEEYCKFTAIRKEIKKLVREGKEVYVTFQSKNGFRFPWILTKDYYLSGEPISKEEFDKIVDSKDREMIDKLSVSGTMKVDEIRRTHNVIGRLQSNKLRYTIPISRITKIECE